MADRVRVLVGTRKGAWIYTSDARRAPWTVSEPVMAGWTVSHMAADSRRSPTRLFAGAARWAWGPSVSRSDDDGATWEQRSPGLAFDPDMGISVGAVWQVRLLDASQPAVVLAGTQPAGLFRSEDGGESWSAVDSVNRHEWRRIWGGTGSGDSSLHSIEQDPREPGRLYISISSGGSYRSEDGGMNWSLCSHGVVATTPDAKKFLEWAASFAPQQPELPPPVSTRRPPTRCTSCASTRPIPTGSGGRHTSASSAPTIAAGTGTT